MAQVKIPTIKLNHGGAIPALGYGTWLGFTETFDFDVSGQQAMMNALSYAIDIGYRHIDTAHFYRIEPEVGAVINGKIAAGVVKREDLFVTTKVWQHHHREDDVEVAVRGSLRRLNLDYLDLVLIHWPMAISEEGVDEKIDYLETWRGFERVLAKGLTKAIGVSNFNIEQMKRLLAHCTVPPAVNQVEINITFGQPELVNYCQANNVVVVAFAPFGSMVPTRATPGSPPPTLDDPTLLAIAKKYGKTVSQVALRHLYQRGIVTIPKTVTKSRVLENASIFDFVLDKSDFDTITKFDVNYRTVKNAFWHGYTFFPFDDVTSKGGVDELPLPLRKWKNGAKLNID